MFSSDVEAYITLEHSFRGIRVLDGIMSSAMWELVVNLAGIDAGEEDGEINKLEITAAYQKVNYWLEYFFQDVIFADADKSEHIVPLNDIGQENALIFVPGSPTDDLIIKLIHSKIHVLSGGKLLIGRVSLRATDMYSVFHYANNADGYCLPDVSYIGDASVHSLPWWERDDTDTYDLSLDDLSVKEREKKLKEINTAPVMQSIVDDIRKSLGLIESDESEEAEIISIATQEEWKPTTV